MIDISKKMSKFAQETENKQMQDDFDIRQEQYGTGSEKDFENALRPLRFGDFSGQEKVVSNLEIFVEAAKYRGEPLDHTCLLYTSPSPRDTR